jgi:hypothetical protein
MSVDVELIPVGFDGLAATLDGWAKRAATIEKAYAVLVADFHAMESRRFHNEGPGWVPLADSTVAERDRLGYGGQPMMVRTDTLALSLTRPGQEGSVFREEAEGFFVGTDVPYAHWHQDGGTTDGRPPQRKLVDFTTADRVRWYAILGRYLAHGLVGEVKVTSGIGPGITLSGPGL